MKLPSLFLLSGLIISLYGAELREIRLSPEASPPETYAAAELKRALEIMTGRDWPVGNNGAASGAIVLGLRPGMAGDTVDMEVKDGSLYLSGSVPRAVLYAAYYYLQKELGVRWLWPGDDGEFIPRRERVELPAANSRYTPAFPYRALSIVGIHKHPQMEVWLTRNFINSGQRTDEILEQSGALRRGSGHSVAIYDKSMWEKHPEYYGMIAGKRDPVKGIAGCWSNPGFHQYMVRKHVDMVRRDRLELLSLYPADTAYHCQCPDCVQIDKDPSTRWFKYFNQLAADIKKECPEIKTASLAYQYYNSVPKVPVPEAEFIEYCQYDRCYFHTLDAPCNRKSMEQIAAWRQAAPNGIYGYAFDMFMVDNRYLYSPFWRQMADALKTFRDQRAVYMKTEAPMKDIDPSRPSKQMTNRFRIGYYLFAQLTWNPDADVDALLREWCELAYGKTAAAPMYDYLQLMMDRWGAMTEHQRGYWWYNPEWTAARFVTPELIRDARKLLKEAGNEMEAELFYEWVQLRQRGNAFVCLPKTDSFERGTGFFAGDIRVDAYWDDTALHFRFAPASKPVEIYLNNASGEYHFKTSESRLTVPFAELNMRPYLKDDIGLRIVCGNAAFPRRETASLHLSDKGSPEEFLTWIMPQKAVNNRNLFITRFANALLESGWSGCELKTTDIMRTDFSKSPLVVITMNKDAVQEIPHEFYTRKLLPYIKSGGLAVLNVSAYDTKSIPDYITGNPALALKFEWCKNGRTQWISDEFASNPADLRKVFAKGIYGTLTPATPSEWLILASQARDGEELKPWLLAHPYGRGTLIISLAPFDESMQAEFFSNLTRNKHVFGKAF